MSRWAALLVVVLMAGCATKQSATTATSAHNVHTAAADTVLHIDSIIERYTERAETHGDTVIVYRTTYKYVYDRERQVIQRDTAEHLADTLTVNAFAAEKKEEQGALAGVIAIIVLLAGVVVGLVIRGKKG